MSEGGPWEDFESRSSIGDLIWGAIGVDEASTFMSPAVMDWSDSMV